MTLNEIKAKATLKGLSMADIAKELEMSRVWMYNRINKQDEDTLKKIEKILA